MRNSFLLLTLSLLSLISGCTSIGYYAQAAKGQLSLLYQAKPIDAWLSDSSVDDGLRIKLKRIQEIRAFAVRELGLPENGSYTSYADLNRQFVVWNVVAAPELSLSPAQWCFPVAGCVDYRGYYNKQAADEFSQELQGKGMDVRVTGVPAYSTLGWFNDPVLSTFINYSETEVARLIFHELAHQIAYAAGDSTFNESFATTVEEIGLSRWLALRDDEALKRNFLLHQGRRSDFLDLLNTYRFKLADVYQQPISDEKKRQKKLELIKLIETDYRLLKQNWGGYSGYDRWFNEPVSNAHFVLIATYHDWVPEFKAILSEQKNLTNFYGVVKEMASMSSSARRQMLKRYTSVVHQRASKIAPNSTAALQ